MQLTPESVFVVLVIVYMIGVKLFAIRANDIDRRVRDLEQRMSKEPRP